MSSILPSPDHRVTPMMAQYAEIKALNPDCLLFYRMGDFYELFFEDAERASRALGITLTKRGKHLGEDIPMCGVPIERAEEYLHRLIDLGHRVAVCDQMEDPSEAKKRGPKAVVRRDIVRLVTPGTLTEERLLDPSRANLFMALVRAMDAPSRYGYAAVDISTGHFLVCETSQNQLLADIARLDPSELVLSDELARDPPMRLLLEELRLPLAPLATSASPQTHISHLCAWYGVATLEGWGPLTSVEIAAASLALEYIERTQVGTKPPLSPPMRRDHTQILEMDAATRANLELTRTLSGERKGSLLHTIDLTCTPAGGRLLAERLANPLTHLLDIETRLEEVAYFHAASPLRHALRDILKRMPDLARAMSRLAMGRGGPRDLAMIREGLFAGCAAKEKLADLSSTLPPSLLQKQKHLLCTDLDLLDHLTRLLIDHPPLHKKEGNFIRSHYCPQLDEARILRDQAKDVIAALQARYVEETQIRPLRIKHNHMLGFFIEVPQTVGDKLLSPAYETRFIHRQTMAGAMRFSTQELSETQSQIASASERAYTQELVLFEESVARVVEQSASLKALCDTMAELDVAIALAELAIQHRWSRPLLTLDLTFHIEGGRHPVVELALKTKGESFIANTCDLTSPLPQAGQIALVTGPNMAGKSTFLRQNALIVILAQMGSFVPAQSAQIGLVDRLFSRVGAADDLARGRSTFMVEMVETATILTRATSKSLVILDEIGRGTATFDGLAIAWAAVEHLHEHIRARTLFATHFHELTHLHHKLSRLINLTVKVTEHRGDVIFLHEVIKGAADRSYGIQVAKLAGLPMPVIARARHLLSEFEAGKGPHKASCVADLPLFSQPSPVSSPSLALQALRDLDLDSLSPREALETLYHLKELERQGHVKEMA